MEIDFNSITTADLTAKLDEMKTKLESIPKKWDTKKSQLGKCEGCRYGDNSDKEQQVINLIQDSYCKEHYTNYNVENATKELSEAVKQYSDELAFRKLIDSVTKTSQIKDIVIAVKAVIKRENSKGWSDKSTITEPEKENARRLLKLLKKLRPKSSVFIDRGVAINEDLFLSGTITDKGGRYGSRPKNKIMLTALDQDENYKAIARVRLTIKQAERLRNLLVDVIEHVKIYSLIDQIGSTMHITIKEDDDDPWDKEEED